MSEKICVFCEHFDWRGIGYAYYSTLTVGAIDGGMCCKKHHFYEERPDDNGGFRAIILKAETCADYAPPPAKDKAKSVVIEA